jgi:ParB family transcriptional regulator, chromosome partitioning protein
LPLSSDAAAAVGSLEGRRRLGGAFLIDLDRIEPDPDQPRKRFDTTAQRELNASVARLGILQPITVRFVEERNIYRIITGQRRFEAAKQANLPQLPCWVQTPQDDQVLLHQIVENWQRADMHPFDLADALARLRDGNGYTQKQIAEETGKSEGEISKLLSLLTLAPDVQQIARGDSTGRITKRHLYAIVKVPNPDQARLIEKAISDHLTATELEELVDANRKDKPIARKRGSPCERIRFKTSVATVTIIFRKKNPTNADIAAALDEAKAKIRNQGSERSE